jgi:hypothetical protein
MCLPSGSLVVGVMMPMGRCVVPNIAGVMSRITPLESPEEGAQQRGIGPYHARKNGALGCLVDNEVL